MFFRALSCITLFAVCNSVSAQSVPAAPAPAKPKVAIRSGEVIPCRVNLGCTDRTGPDGHHTYILEADGYIVEADFQVDQRFSHADVTIVNNSPNKLQLIPAEFRIDVVQPKYRRLSYLDPKRVEKTSKTSKKVKDLPPPSYFTSDKHTQDKQKEAAAIPVPPLKPRALGPSERESGRVYFQHPGKATEMSLVLPISGELFEFTYPPVGSGQ
ncbi:hypothetical protein SAMN05421770_10367 [Granulicella rosea]|uniref:Uncharacterized protein n=1 Tax=Granulicella rosea TaxID=474952 RepID=A0A239IDZ2_9BACT|nr:hypothetical protein [Granulicella rosea]SNS91767.1 hypothetical protein SAMN05421770_10367 [Granulicella rosea]